ncbi:alpha/beta fold hydrolase [Paenibacillus sp. FSL R5-0486]|uniref:thioesterase II family protein n=1 Tax=unclassified Paenibacillus TaxID=185978 RepID=UPI0030D7654D
MNTEMKPVLFCIPYAGGSSSIYYKWKKELESTIKVIPLEMSGHGSRLNEPLYSNIDEGAQDLLSQLKRGDIDTPYIIFGHSLGGMLAYEVSRKIQINGDPPPTRIIISGCLPPGKFGTSRQEKVKDMDDDQLIETLRDLGGTSEMLLEEPELLRLFLPIIRNDFHIVDNYQHIPTEPLNIPLSVYIGERDVPCDLKSVMEWQHFTTLPCTDVKVFRGGHFFIHEDEQSVLQQISVETSNLSCTGSE